jgi:hypothetical protein
MISTAAGSGPLTASNATGNTIAVGTPNINIPTNTNEKTEQNTAKTQHPPSANLIAAAHMI